MKNDRPLLDQVLYTKPGKSWKGEKIYFHGDDYFRDVLAAIRKSKKTVEIETYIYEPGRLGDQMAAALLSAHQRGVQVRLLVDGIGSPEFLDHYGPRLEKAGLQFRIYRSWPTFFSSIIHRFQLIRPLRSLQYALAVWNSGKHRDHRKQYIVDGDKIWIGSFNVSDWHSDRIKGKSVWRDTGIGLRGVKSLVFRLAFHAAWEDPWPHHFAHMYRHSLIKWLMKDVEGSPIRMTVGRKLRRLFRKELLARINSAKSRVWVLTPYFVPTGPLLRALVRSARRGCDVRVILPGHSDVPVVSWTSKVFYPALLKAGCRIFEFQKRVLHAKTLFIDPWVLVGSSNLDYRSLKKDLEVNVIPREKKSLQALERQFKKDLLNCKESSIVELEKRPFWGRFLSAIFFHFRYWF